MGGRPAWDSGRPSAFNFWRGGEFVAFNFRRSGVAPHVLLEELHNRLRGRWLIGLEVDVSERSLGRHLELVIRPRVLLGTEPLAPRCRQGAYHAWCLQQ